MFTHIEDSELKTLIEDALTSEHPLIQQAIQHEQAFRMSTAGELKELFETVQKAIRNGIEAETCDPERYIANLKKKILEKIELDITSANALEQALKAYSPVAFNPAGGQCLYPLKFNKIAYELPAVKQFVLDADFSKLFLDGEIPAGYQFQTTPQEITYLHCNPNSIYGDRKGVILKLALFETYFAITGKKFSDLDLSCSKKTKTKKWIDGSAMVHVAPLPKGLDLKTLRESNPGFPFLGNDELYYPHSGYVYGGDRYKTRPDKSPELLPEDCTSDLEKQCPNPSTQKSFTFTTGDLTKLHQRLMDIASPQSSTSTNPMENTFDVVRDWQQDPARAQPGQIYSAGGHAAISLGVKSAGSNSTVALIGCARNYPVGPEGGRGIHVLPLNLASGMFFHYKGTSTGKLEQSDTHSLPKQPKTKTTEAKRSQD